MFFTFLFLKIFISFVEKIYLDFLERKSTFLFMQLASRSKLPKEFL